MASDEVAVITGGASGFGLALGAECAARGLRVALLDRDGERAAAEAVRLAAANNVEVIGLAADVADARSVQAAAASIAERFARVDLVVSNVGVQLFGSTARLTDDEWRWVLDVNVIGAARTVRAFLPMLRAAPRGRLTFTTSVSVLAPASRMGAYQASKFAVWGLAETLRLEEPGIAVSVLFPSGMLSRHLETSESAQPDAIRRAIGEQEDFEVMAASNPGMIEDLASPEQAAANVIDDLLAGERYIVTHGNVATAVEERNATLQRAATKAGEP